MIQTEQLPVETRKSPLRRRWLWMVIVVVIAVALVIPLMWHRPSPLSETERRIVGEWSFVDSNDRRLTRRFQFRPDRTFSYWETEMMRDDGTWKTSGQELIFFFSQDNGVPSGILDSIHYMIDRILHPKNYTPAESRVTLDEISPTAIHVRESNGTKLVFQRSGAAGN